MQKKTLIAVLAACILLSLSGVSFSSDQPRVINVSGVQSYKEAEAKIKVWNDYTTYLVLLEFEASGLVPYGAYTVWFGNDETSVSSMEGIGYSPYTFAADRNGRARYSAKIYKEILGKWEFLRVFFHIDGEALNTAVENLNLAFVIEKEPLFKSLRE